MIGSDTADVGVLKSAALRFCVCSSIWRRKAMPAPQGLAVPQRRGSLVGQSAGDNRAGVRADTIKSLEVKFSKMGKIHHGA
jgi:hypothetical protein